MPSCRYTSAIFSAKFEVAASARRRRSTTLKFQPSRVASAGRTLAIGATKGQRFSVNVFSGGRSPARSSAGANRRSRNVAASSSMIAATSRDRSATMSRVAMSGCRAMATTGAAQWRSVA